MSDYDISIESQSQLSDVIVTLEKDMQNIVESIKRINNIVKKLDKTVWDSPEKQKVEDEFFVYLKENEDYIEPLLKDRISVLKRAQQLYINRDLQIKKETEKL